MRHLDIRSPAILVLVLGLWIFPAAAQEPAPADSDAGPPTEAGASVAFSGEVEISLINLYISVVDKDGRPVSGLSKEDFGIYEAGERMEITNFVEIHRGDPVTEKVSASSEAAPLIDMDTGQDSSTGRQAEYLIILFDNTTLQSRNRKRVIKALDEAIAQGLGSDRQIMLAVNSPRLQIVQAFTTDPAAIKTALRAIRKVDTQGEMISSSKRILERDITTAKLNRATYQQVPATSTGSGGGGGGGGGGGTVPQPPQIVIGADTAYLMAQGQTFKNRINVLRYQQYETVRNTLVNLDELLRSLSGLPGKKDVIWVGEDLALRPAMDVYSTYYERFQRWEAELSIDQPAFWGQEVELSSEFAYVAAGAQAAGATMHLIDASNRDRDMGNTDFGSTDLGSFTFVEGGDTALASGYNMSSVGDLVDGSQFLAGATGGSVFFNSRNFDKFFDRLNDRLGSYYSIGYRHPGEADGQLHSVKVDLADSADAKAQYRKKVLARTAAQTLADATLSRLRLGNGLDQLGLQASVGDMEPTESEKIIRPVRLAIPARNLVLSPEDGEHVGKVLVLLQSMSATGVVFPPQLMQLTIRIPAANLSPVTTATATLRLMMDEDTAKVAVGVHDQGSGSESTTIVEVH